MADRDKQVERARQALEEQQERARVEAERRQEEGADRPDPRTKSAGQKKKTADMWNQ